MVIILNSIGQVHSPFKNKQDIDPEKFASSNGFDQIVGELEINNEFADGLTDIEDFSHIIVVFGFHKAEGFKLLTTPFLDTTPRGVFATRSPHRPNPIGMTIVKIIERKNNVLRVSGMDMLEGTPILDIKPYTPRDQKEGIELGWLTDKIK
ncbi:MAG: tRNA (N6-threonylcarbamoyladenosine(37)-N6)-methyltransferase TrmO [Candidatus Aminicenantes bacterium]|nr:tRNA (N6-threonylcarbamoyladenosine(37)-N6)-methyltransferase TrmO [Candidatus Aminicenantes bacterium]